MAKKSKSQTRFYRVYEEALNLGLKIIRKIIKEDSCIDDEVMKPIFKQKLPHSEILEGFNTICGGLFPIFIAIVDISLSIDECDDEQSIAKALLKPSYIMNYEDSLNVRKFIMRGYKKFEDFMIEEAEKIFKVLPDNPKTLIQALFLARGPIKILVSQIIVGV